MQFLEEIYKNFFRYFEFLAKNGDPRYVDQKLSFVEKNQCKDLLSQAQNFVQRAQKKDEEEKLLRQKQEEERKALRFKQEEEKVNLCCPFLEIQLLFF